MKTSAMNEVLLDELILSVRRRGQRCSVDVSNALPCDRAFMTALAGVVAVWYNRRNRRTDHDA